MRRWVYDVLYFGRRENRGMRRRMRRNQSEYVNRRVERLD